MDTVNLANTWEQLHAAYAYGVDRLWMFNAGDMKNSEAALQFALDYAWDPDALSSGNLAAWELGYAAQNFGAKYAAAIADVLTTYGRLQGRRKPELLNRKISLDPARDLSTDEAAVVYDDQAGPYSLNNYRELDRVTAEWARLRAKADRIGDRLPAYKRDAYYELVRYQVDATANLYALRNAEFNNLFYASQGRAATNRLADVAEARFADDQAMGAYYNNELAGGKWRGWQLQPHIGYGDVARYGPNAPWQQPELSNKALTDVVFPAVRRIGLPALADMGVAIDGSDQWWPHAAGPAVLPSFSPYQTAPAQYIDIFNRGSVPFDFKIEAGRPWVIVGPGRGRVTDQVRVTVSIDWSRAPKGNTRAPITVGGPGGKTVTVEAILENPGIGRSMPTGLVEAGGYISVPADAYSRAVSSAGIRWRKIVGIGRTGDGIEPFPQTAQPVTAGGGSPRLEYDLTLFTTGLVTVCVYLSPRNDVLANGGLRYAVSIDNDAPQIVNIATATGAADAVMNRQWQRNTSNNVNLTSTTHKISTAGHHVLRFWMVDPTVVLQNIVVDTGGLRESYLGPPASMPRPAGLAKSV
ncbi:MAG TPA: glycosyl hydrolase 115 family protein [Candidatus Limnocylindrales bacterium]